MAQAYIAAEALVLSLFVCHFATLLPNYDTQVERSPSNLEPDNQVIEVKKLGRWRKWSSALHKLGRSLAKLMTWMLVPLLVILLMVMLTDAFSRSLSNFGWSAFFDGM